MNGKSEGLDRLDAKLNSLLGWLLNLQHPLILTRHNHHHGPAQVNMALRSLLRTADHMMFIDVEMNWLLLMKCTGGLQHLDSPMTITAAITRLSLLQCDREMKWKRVVVGVCVCLCFPLS